MNATKNYENKQKTDPKTYVPKVTLMNQNVQKPSNPPIIYSRSKSPKIKSIYKKVNQPKIHLKLIR